MTQCKRISVLIFGIAQLAVGGMVWAAPQSQAKTTYNTAEFNAYQTAAAEKDPQNQIKLLDDLVQKYPSSELQGLLPSIYPVYYADYLNLKNYPQAFTYIDKMLALGDRITTLERLRALAVRATAFTQTSTDKTLQTADGYAKARDAAADGLKTVDKWQKPDGTSDADFNKTKKDLAELFDSAAAVAETGLKDFKGSETSYKAALVINPDNALTHYRLANAYLQDSPAQSLDGFWEMARAIALKVPSTDAVKSYLRDRMLHYQQPACDKLLDEVLSNMITLASSSSDRPASLTIPSADDLEKAREDTANFMAWLHEGGDHGNVMWLATCGTEYTDVPVKVIEVTAGDGDSLIFKMYRPTASEPDAQAKELDSATAGNMEVHVASQPDAKRLQNGDEVRFTGTLSGYTQLPFELIWDGAKINADDIPANKPTPGAPKRHAPSARK